MGDHIGRGGGGVCSVGRPWGVHFRHGQLGVDLALKLVRVEAFLGSGKGASERGRAGKLWYHMIVHSCKHICGNGVLRSSTDACDKIII